MQCLHTGKVTTLKIKSSITSMIKKRENGNRCVIVFGLLSTFIVNFFLQSLILDCDKLFIYSGDVEVVEGNTTHSVVLLN